MNLHYSMTSKSIYKNEKNIFVRFLGWIETFALYIVTLLFCTKYVNKYIQWIIFMLSISGPLVLCDASFKLILSALYFMFNSHTSLLFLYSSYSITVIAILMTSQKVTLAAVYIINNSGHIYNIVDMLSHYLSRSLS